MSSDGADRDSKDLDDLSFEEALALTGPDGGVAGVRFADARPVNCDVRAWDEAGAHLHTRC